MTVFNILFFVVLVIIGIVSATFLVSFVNDTTARRSSSILRLTPLQLVLFGTMILSLFGGLGLFAFIGWRSSKFGAEGFPPLHVMLYFAAAFFAFVGIAFVMIILANRQRLHVQGARDDKTQLLFERIRGSLPLERPLFVYLRPFSVAKERSLTEDLVIQLLEQRGILICVDEAGFQYGMGRLTLSDDEWQPAVLLLCQRAAGIVMYPGASAGVLWELEQISNHGWLDRTLFFMPPSLMNFYRIGRFLIRRFPRLRDSVKPGELEELEMREDISGHWERARARAREIGVDLPAYCDKGGIFRLRFGKLEWVMVFARDIFFGKTPKGSLDPLGPVIDEYASRPNAPPGRNQALGA